MLFRKAMEDTILNVSPLVRHGLPYLETEAGRNAPVRRYLPEVLYFSQQLKHESPPRKSKYEEGNHSPERFQRLSVNERNVPENLHPFLRVRITPDMSKKQLLALLSDFRARGVRPRTGDKPVIALKAPAISDERENTAMEQEQQHPDCLNPFNLQRLCVLFSSSCHNVPNASHFCVSPWYLYLFIDLLLIFQKLKEKHGLSFIHSFNYRVVEMDFYGRNDIALGGFLERYCFHANYTCPSISCQAPITSHVRRFVHANSSILVILRQLANPVNSNVGPNDDRTILMWSWCKKCKQVCDQFADKSKLYKTITKRKLSIKRL